MSIWGKGTIPLPPPDFFVPLGLKNTFFWVLSKTNEKIFAPSCSYILRLGVPVGLLSHSKSENLCNSREHRDVISKTNEKIFTPSPSYIL